MRACFAVAETPPFKQINRGFAEDDACALDVSLDLRFFYLSLL